MVVAAAALAAPADAVAGPVRAGAATVDASWHVGASAGQYASDGTLVSPEDGTYNPTAESYRRLPSYGIQSRLQVRALVVQGPSGNRIALVKNDFYIPQDLIYRRTAQLLEAKPELGIGRQNLTMAISHDHSSPFYASTGWGVWTFQDVFDVRFYNYYAERMARAVEIAATHLVPVRVGAAVSQFGDTHRHSFGPAVADDGTPAGYLNKDTDHDLTVVRFDDISDPGHVKPLANLVNFGQHPESLSGNDLISADYLAPLQKYVDDGTGATTIFTQGAVGTSEPERSTWHDVHQRLEFSHREYGQAEYAARLMANTVLKTWRDISTATPEDPNRFVPFRSDFAGDEVNMRDEWFPGPVSHPYPGVSSCRTDPAFKGDPRVPVVGLPDCEGVQSGLENEFGVPVHEVVPPIDPGLTTDDFERLGIPVPENYSAPSYTGLEEDIDVHVQAFRIGDVLFTVCSCEQWSDQSKNIKTRTDQVAGDEYLGYDWQQGGPDLFGSSALPLPSVNTPPCTQNHDGSYGDGPEGYGTGTWKCPNPSKPSESLPGDLPDKLVERMHRQVVNPANGWNNISYASQAESESANLRDIKGNYTHDDLCVDTSAALEPVEPENDVWDKPCGPGEGSPSANLGYRLTVAIAMANDYNGYIATYREYQNRDHYRKALTGWGPHSSDYLASRLVNMGRVLRGGDPDTLLPPEYGGGKVALDLAHNDQRANALGRTGNAAIAAYDARLPDDGGTAAPVKQPKKDLERFGGEYFTWMGGSNYTDNPDVRVQRKLAGVWHDYAGQAGEIPVTIQYPHGTDEPSYESGSFEWRWTAHFEVFAAPFQTAEGTQATPVGVYRFVVDGQRRQGHQVVPYHVQSAEFRVHAWSGIAVRGMRLDGDRHVRFQIGPRTRDKVHRSIDSGKDVTVPEVGPIDYPDSYDYGPGGPLPRFIRRDLQIREDPSHDPSKGELYCFTCHFRPWLDAGDAHTATVAFQTPGKIEQVPAREIGQGLSSSWRTTKALPARATAQVGRGCVKDPFGDYNGSDSAGVGAGSGVQGPDNCPIENPETSARRRRFRCARASGRIRGRRLGRARLRVTRRVERRAFPKFERRRSRVDRFCLRGGKHIRVGYMSRRRASLFLRATTRLSDRAVLVLSSHRRYRLRGVGPGARVSKLRRRFRRTQSFQIGRNRWYVARGRKARLVFKTHRGRVEEVGIAELRLTRGAARARRFLRGFS